MNIYYITHARMPTEKAHGFQIAKTCEALVQKGASVTLCVPRRANPIQDDMFSYYDIEENFSVRYCSAPSMLWLPIPRINFYLTSLIFLFRVMFLRVPKDAVVYTRSAEIAWWFSGKRTTFFEGHTWPNSGSRILRFLLRGVDLIITNSQGTADAFASHTGKDVVVARNGVDLSLYEHMPTQAEARAQFDIPRDAYVALYVGRFEKWKGIDTLLSAAELSKDSMVLFVLSGGIASEEEHIRERVVERELSNVLIVSPQFGKEVPKLLATADVVLLPNAPVSAEAVTHTSPIKSFIYMASGKPIVASDLPSIREVLNKENATLVRAGDGAALCAGIEEVRANASVAMQRAQKAREDVRLYTWEKRAEIIIDNMGKFLEIR